MLFICCVFCSIHGCPQFIAVYLSDVSLGDRIPALAFDQPLAVFGDEQAAGVLPLSAAR